MSGDISLGKYVGDLKSRIVDLHLAHGVGGDGLSCIECVISVLNQVEFETVQMIKNRLENRDGS